MIKPEDIPESLKRVVSEETIGVVYKEDVAAILNAAIEAGVVSPPCYCVRQNGELRTWDDGKPKVFPGSPPYRNDTEHWKGQAE